MAKKPTYQRGPSPAIWNDQIEAPRADIKSTEQSAKRMRFVRGGVWVSVIGSPLLIVAVVVLLGRSTTPTTTAAVAPPSIGAATSPGRSVATVSLSAWMSQTPSPLPGVKLIGWIGAKKVASIIPTAGKAKPGLLTDGGNGSTTGQFTSAEIDSFSLVDGNGSLYTASIEVALDTRSGGGAQTVSGVSLVPVAPSASDGWANGVPWPGLTAATEPGAVDTAIQSWAAAYTSGNSATLGQSVRDPSATHQYVPLTNVRSFTAAPGTAAFLDTTNTTMVIQVSLVIQWVGQPATDPSTTSQNQVATTLDLLVDQAQTAAPVVVAWGAPGSGPSLKPYSNAVSAVAPRPLPSSTATPSAGQTSTASPSSHPSTKVITKAPVKKVAPKVPAKKKGK